MKKIIVTAVCMAVVLGGIFYFHHIEKWRRTFRVTFLDVGQGDGALINFANGEKMLVDCGIDKLVLSRLGKALALWDTTIDYLLVTHTHLDHYGGCVDVIKRYDVKHIITNGRSNPRDMYWQELEKAIQEEGAKVTAMTHPTTWMISGDTLTFLSPDPDLALNNKADDANNYSIVFRLRHEEKNFLFTGDMEAPLEQALTKKYCHVTIPTEGCAALRSDVLKVGHHGSDTSSGGEFLKFVQPTTAIISVGENNYGHPSRRILKRFERSGVSVLRTDVLGDIIIQ